MTKIKGAITAILALATAIPMLVRYSYYEYRWIDQFSKNACNLKHDRDMRREGWGGS